MRAIADKRDASDRVQERRERSRTREMRAIADKRDAMNRVCTKARSGDAIYRVCEE
ncbi:MAG: hypothetical protein V7L01_05415 [Nostoc sp.]|uniref:hypothetical protein n=1 Tax=Nostoc sp. TaxID=1180 RepID=UPI002FFA8B42